MAEEQKNQESVADALSNEEQSGAPRGPKKIFRILLMVGVVAVAIGAGHFVSRLRKAEASPPKPAPAAAAATAQEPQEAPGEPGGDDSYEYVDMDAITVNLNEPRLARYIRVTLSLAIRSSDAKVAKKTIQDNMPELKNYVILYLADCSLDEVRGSNSLNHILREVRDSFNTRLWPNGRPLIAKVGYREWVIQ